MHPRLSFTLLAFPLLLGLSQGCKPKDPQTNGGNPKDSVVTPQPSVPVFASPEGAAWDGTHLYISNVGAKLEPDVKDGDGYIMRLNATGTEWLDSAAFNALPLNAPKGMVIINKTLYVTDIDRLVAINLKQPQILWTIDFKRFNANFLNDVTVKDDSTVFVSATDINTIFEVDLIGQGIKPLKVKGLSGPNGLLYQSEEGKLYCVEYGSQEAPGRILRIDPPSGKMEVLHSHRGGLDGLVMLRTGELAFSDWDTKGVHKLDLRTNALSRIATDSILGPADIAYDAATERLWIPRMMENKLTVLEGPQLK